MGVGSFIVHAVRADGRGRWRVSQRFDEADGSTSESVTKGDVVWGGHGHDHWHVHLGASYWLTRPDSTEVLRSYDKVGFCFFDQRPLVDAAVDRAGAPQFPKSGVQRSPDPLEFTMGVSPGWADPYPWALPDQRLLLTGLEDGVYRLWAAADPGNWFKEANETNNATWVDIRDAAQADSACRQVVRRGASARPPGKASRQSDVQLQSDIAADGSALVHSESP